MTGQAFGATAALLAVVLGGSEPMAGEVYPGAEWAAKRPGEATRI